MAADRNQHAVEALKTAKKTRRTRRIMQLLVSQYFSRKVFKLNILRGKKRATVAQPPLNQYLAAPDREKRTTERSRHHDQQLLISQYFTNNMFAPNTLRAGA